VAASLYYVTVHVSFLAYIIIDYSYCITPSVKENPSVSLSA